MTVTFPIGVLILLVVTMWFRHEVIDVLGGITDYAIGGISYAWPVIRKFVFIGLGLWTLLIVVLVGIGIYAHSPWSALTVGLLFPIWFFVVFVPPFVHKWWYVGPMFRITKIWTGRFLLVAVIWLMVGLWSPENKDAIYEWNGNKKADIGFFFKKRALQSQKKIGVFGIVSEGATAYDNSGYPTFFIPKGTRVKIDNLDGKDADVHIEGMTLVMIPNKFGDFIQGNKGYVPSRKIDWNWEKENVKDAAPVIPGPAKPARAWSGQITYGHWDPEHLGAVKIATLDPGKYRISFKELSNLLAPEGKLGTHKFQNEVPVPSAAPGSRIMKIRNASWQYAGSGTEFQVSERSDVLVSLNVRQNNPKNFLGSAVRDEIEITSIN